jgi:predicted CoA-binding protein
MLPHNAHNNTDIVNFFRRYQQVHACLSSLTTNTTEYSWVEPRGVTSQETTFFRVTAVKTSVLTVFNLCTLLYTYDTTGNIKIVLIRFFKK